jgi:hypothetical protein
MLAVLHLSGRVLPLKKTLASVRAGQWAASCKAGLGHAGLKIVGFYVSALEAALPASMTQLCRILLSLRSCEILTGGGVFRRPAPSLPPESSLRLSDSHTPPLLSKVSAEPYLA